MSTLNVTHPPVLKAHVLICARKLLRFAGDIVSFRVHVPPPPFPAPLSSPTCTHSAS